MERNIKIIEQKKKQEEEHSNELGVLIWDLPPDFAPCDSFSLPKMKNTMKENVLLILKI